MRYTHRVLSMGSIASLSLFLFSVCRALSATERMWVKRVSLSLFQCVPCTVNKRTFVGQGRVSLYRVSITDSLFSVRRALSTINQ